MLKAKELSRPAEACHHLTPAARGQLLWRTAKHRYLQLAGVVFKVEQLQMVETT